MNRVPSGNHTLAGYVYFQHAWGDTRTLRILYTPNCNLSHTLPRIIAVPYLEDGTLRKQSASETLHVCTRFFAIAFYSIGQK